MEKTTVSMCEGCCCGHPEKGNPLVMREEFAQLLESSGISSQVCLQSPYCLGPCQMANVVKVETGGKSIWFSRMNSIEDIEALASFLKNPSKLPLRLEKKQFRF